MKHFFNNLRLILLITQKSFINSYKNPYKKLLYISITLTALISMSCILIHGITKGIHNAAYQSIRSNVPDIIVEDHINDTFEALLHKNSNIEEIKKILLCNGYIQVGKKKTPCIILSSTQVDDTPIQVSQKLYTHIKTKNIDFIDLVYQNNTKQKVKTKNMQKFTKSISITSEGTFIYIPLIPSNIQTEKYTYITLKSAHNFEIIRSIISDANKHHPNTKIYSWYDQIPNIEESFYIEKKGIDIVTLLLTVISIISGCGALYLYLLGRRKNFITLLSWGANKKSVILISSLIGTISLCIGCTFGITLAHTIAYLLNTYKLIPIPIENAISSYISCSIESSYCMIIFFIHIISGLCIGLYNCINMRKQTLAEDKKSYT